MTSGLPAERVGPPRLLWGLLAALFLVIAVFRFLALKNGFPNDHFLHLAGARQMLLGDWPTRDFQDPGLPLMYVMSAGAQLLFGHTLFAEAVFVALAFAAAAALTGLAVYELTRSTLLAVVAVVLEVIIFPRTYGYPKLLVYAAAFFLMQRYVSRPTAPRLVAIGVAAVVAFLFRHDHGLYVAAGGLLTVALTPVDASLTRAREEPTRVRARVRSTLILAVVMAALVAPYLLYVQVHGGVPLYFRTGMEFSAREAGRQGHVWPSLSEVAGNREALLVYVLHGLPIVAALTVLARSRAADVRTRVARVVPLAAVAVFTNVSFIRDPLHTRLPDAIVPATMLVTWLVHSAWTAAPSRRRTALPVAVAFLASFAYSVAIVGHVGEELDRAGLMVSWTRVPGYVRELAATLRTPLAETQIPSSAAGHLLPFLAYVERCTTPDQRLLVTGFMPEVPVLTGRGFAGGQSTFIPGYFSSDENQRLVLRRLRDQAVPFALLPKDYASELDVAFPALMGYVRSRYVPLASFGADSESGVEVLVDGTMRWPARDGATGWPCARVQ